MKDVIIITGASSGFGALVARALARAVHTVYASMRETAGRNAPQVAEANPTKKLGRTWSETALTTSAPSCVGSTSTRKGRLPKGVSTTWTNPLSTWSAKPA